MAKKYKYEVHGFGSFPTDMLRYDQAEITGSMDVDGHKTYIIVGNRTPTIGRWESFMWHVNNVEKV
jgi:hypothetical protein